MSQQGTRYFTGKPCKYGHVAERMTRNRTCVECANLARAKRASENRGAENARKRDWAALNADSVSMSKARYKKNNPAKIAADTARRRAAKLQRTPGWLTDDEHWLIDEIYDLARQRSESTGIPHEVDHIAPLRGKAVSGLHTPWNMQVLPSAENYSKGNAYEAQA